MRTKVPCRECKERYVGCHDKCNLYQEYRETREIIQANRKKYNDDTGEQILSVFRCIK